jgi:predicted TPR repeat methyltransferase
MIFKSDNAGPWYLSSEQKDAQCDDRATGRSRRVARSKKLLTKVLTEAGVELTQQRNFTRRELQAFATKSMYLKRSNRS